MHTREKQIERISIVYISKVGYTDGIKINIHDGNVYELCMLYTLCIKR